MNVSLYIAKRYLFSKKSHQAINIISGVAVAGVTLATIAMVCTLSVFNGFKMLVAEQFTAFDPEIKITAERGKSFDASSEFIKSVKKLPEIAVATECFEDKVMIQYNGRQVMATIKGVEDNFAQLTEIEKVLIGNGSFKLHDNTVDYATPGIELTGMLNCGLYHTAPLEIFAPKRGKKVSMANPASNFRKGYLYASGKTFIVNQPKYDSNYILSSIAFARDIFGRDSTEISSLELKVTEGTDINKLKSRIKNILGEEFKVEDRYEQQADVFRIMTIEKFISYLFLSLILLIACFNVIGSLSMLILDKKKDMETLRSLGANDKIISGIFIIEGSMISIFGAFTGIVLGVAVCLVQEKFGIISFGDASGGFVIDSYPVDIIASDVAAVFVTVIAVGLLAMGIPVNYLTKRLLNNDSKD
ncbi:MAG: ABC transporter permease [Bacteroidaceae bacterium]|nr:ABC transporter permease [Bacteroidaceae bacterium]